jgi:hypothetical protein
VWGPRPRRGFSRNAVKGGTPEVAARAQGGGVGGMDGLAVEQIANSEEDDQGEEQGGSQQEAGALEAQQQGRSAQAVPEGEQAGALEAQQEQATGRTGRRQYRSSRRARR